MESSIVNLLSSESEDIPEYLHGFSIDHDTSRLRSNMNDHMKGELDQAIGSVHPIISWPLETGILSGVGLIPQRLEA